MSKGGNLNDFIDSLHPSTTVLSTGTASVLGNEVLAVLTRNVYRQEIVWGYFGCSRGKFKGTLSNNAATEEVVYVASTS